MTMQETPDRDEWLDALLEQADDPLSDGGFTAAVMRRTHRRRLTQNFAWLIPAVAGLIAAIFFLPFDYSAAQSPALFKWTDDFIRATNMVGVQSMILLSAAVAGLILAFDSDS